MAIVGNFVDNSVIMFILFGTDSKFIKDIKLNCYFLLAVLKLMPRLLPTLKLLLPTTEYSD